MKIKKEEFQKIAERYLDGIKTSQLADEHKVSKATINRIVKKIIGRQVIRLSKMQYLEIVNKYNKGEKIKDIADDYKICIGTITRILYECGVREKSINSKSKGGFSQLEKDNIIDLYANQHRGKSYIAKLFNRADVSISYWLRKWGVETISRSEISKTIRSIYGPTNGFTGHIHTLESKDRISISGKQAWQQGREVTIGKSRTYSTIIGQVLGRFEVAYIQKCYEFDGILPEVCHKRYNTPYGSYKPDFFKNGRFIEIKSKFTLRVAKGQYHNNKGQYCDKQWKKISYFMENIAQLDVIVLDNNEASQLFSRAKYILLH
jgi:DNA-binding MarR family transcriptional regulator/transposase-like protein